LDFVFFGVGCFVAILRAGLALALPRFEPFLRTATRFFAFAMAISCEIMLPARQSYVALWQNDSPLGGDNPIGRDAGNLGMGRLPRLPIICRLHGR
jgi:hypothetical protein